MAMASRAYANYLAQHPEFSSSLVCDATNNWVRENGLGRENGWVTEKEGVREKCV